MQIYDMRKNFWTDWTTEQRERAFAAAPEMAHEIEVLLDWAAMFDAFRDNPGQAVLAEARALLARIKGETA